MTQVEKSTHSTAEYPTSTLPVESSCPFSIDFVNVYFLKSLSLLQNQFPQQKMRGHCLFRAALNTKNTELH